MKKFVVVESNRAVRVVGCVDPSVISMTENQSLIEVDANRKVKKGDAFFLPIKTISPAPVEVKVEDVVIVEEKKSYWKVAAAIAAAGGSALAFYMVKY